MHDSSNLQLGLIVIHLPIMQIQPCLSVIYGEGISDNLRKFMCSGGHLFLDNMKQIISFFPLSSLRASLVCPGLFCLLM